MGAIGKGVEIQYLSELYEIEGARRIGAKGSFKWLFPSCRVEMGTRRLERDGDFVCEVTFAYSKDDLEDNGAWFEDYELNQKLLVKFTMDDNGIHTLDATHYWDSSRKDFV